MLQISAKPRAMLIAATMIVAAANSAAAQNAMYPVEYDDKIYIRYATGNRFFISPQSSQNWPAGRHSGDNPNGNSERVAFKIKGESGKAGSVKHFDIVAIETSVTTHEGYNRAYCSAQWNVYFDTAKALGEAPEQWWRILREKGDGIIAEGDVIYFQNRYYPRLYLTSVADGTWLKCAENRCPFKFELDADHAVQISSAPRPGNEGESSDYVDDIVYVENPSDDPLVSGSQTWTISETQSAQIGSSTTKQWEAGVSISSEYQLGIFKGDVELSAKYSEAVSKERSQVMESNVQKSVTGNYSLPANGYAFLRARLLIPYRVYDAVTNEMTLQLRKYHGGLKLTTLSVTRIPQQRASDGTITPTPLQEVLAVLEEFAKKDPDEARRIRAKLPEWQARGLVTGGSTSSPRPSPSPMPNPSPGPSPSPMVQLNVATVPGIYQRNPVQDPWHKGRITVGPNNNFIWTNEGGRSWSLAPDLANRALRTGADNPYVNEGVRDFTLESNGANVTGFRFNDELYSRVGDAGPAPNPNPMPIPVPVPQLTREAVLGNYERTPVEDPWHQGRISAGPNGTLHWTNSAGVRWTLTPDLANKMLRTGSDNPYVNDGIRDFTIETSGGQVTGFRFNSELYRRQP